MSDFKPCHTSAAFTPHQCNILVDNSNHARIADFGLVMVTQDLNFMQSASSPTSRWTAPEVLEDGPYSKEADVFSFAMVMIEVRCA